ncbi:N-acetylneuraminate synthase family protein [Sphingobacterium wenxiniae]|uniref:N-acetylneuraminate synthase n=1 Tax=Sphingobacterium wenxiniae TaxID=683125 RepID=A0A1I6U7Z8_9SPHI|nr:N-acetylneuraminate synthase family protein [Sphingobacterium wenxiniae]SFS97521.1 N-acetylneuraminate synthase [Sphingobacterium wenxiniae]
MENCLDQIRNIFLESNKTKIAIVGKGNSIKDVSVEKLQDDYFIITLNDAGLSLNADFTVFYKAELLSIYKRDGFSSKYYLAPEDVKLPSSQHIPAEYHSFDQDGIERIYTYFASSEFYILDFTLLSAIKLAIEFQAVKGILTETAFLGFDFYMPSVQDNDLHGLEYRNAHLRTQESLFVTILQHIQKQYPLLELQHVGNKKYSALSVEDFQKSLYRYIESYALKTNSTLYQELLDELDSSNKVIVVAEFTNNHIGDRNRLLKMIELAKESGADMIKVQKRDVDTFYTEEELNAPYSSPFGNTLRDYRNAVELSDELFDLLDLECRKRDIPWFASVLDWNSYLYMQKLDCPIIKLPSTISNHKNYLTKVAEDFKGELVVSTGFTDEDYENFVLNNLVRENKFFLLQCTSSYPTPPEGCQVSVVRHYDALREKYPNIVPGYSSHDLGSLGCMMAVAAGARMIEKHVKLGDLEWVHFDSVAIDLYNSNFKQFVSDIRRAEIMCGSKVKQVYQFEHHKYQANNKVN